MTDPAIGWIREVVLDAEDPWALARFWAELLGGTPVEWYPGWVTLEPPPHGQRLSFPGTATAAIWPDTPSAWSFARSLLNWACSSEAFWLDLSGLRRSQAIGRCWCL